MRELKPAEQNIVAGGRDAEFRTIIRNEIPRFEEPPQGLQTQGLLIELQGSGTPAEAEQCTPMSWLPPREDLGDIR